NQSTVTTLRVRAVEPANGVWTFAAQGVPPGVIVAFVPPTVNGGGDVQVRITVGPGVPAGVYHLGLMPLCNGVNAGTLPFDLTVLPGMTPDLALAKHRDGRVTAGQNATYRLTVTNSGRAPTSGVITVTDALPDGLTFVSGSGPGWSCSAA